MTKQVSLGISALAVAIQCASANIVFDLRALGSDGVTASKNAVISPGGQVTLQIWAEVTNATPTNNIFGVQSILGAIVSSGATGITGSIAPMTFPSVFNSTSVAGNSVELSSPVDTLTDLGASSTTATAGYIKPRKDPTAAPGETIPGGSFFYVTNNQPGGATFDQITNGYEFLMGTTTLSIQSLGTYTQGGTVNWKIPGFTTAALKGQIALWTQGDGVNDTGSVQFAQMSVGAPVSLVVVPEPSAFGMVFLGALGVVGFRRFGLRSA